MRPSGRTPEQMRDIRITRNYTIHAEGDNPFTKTQLSEMLGLASNSIKNLVEKQRDALS